jgi:N-methylhydantoinase A
LTAQGDGRRHPVMAAVDIGGTFTDVVALDEHGVLSVDKLLTTLPNQGEGAVDGLQRALGALDSLTVLKHGTTAVINAVLERKGARVGMVTTRGFRDIVEIGRGNRTRPYDVFYKHPEPLVPRHLRFEIDERIAADGSVVRELDTAALAALAEQLRESGVAAVAVSFLNSYVAPRHEEAVVSALAEALPGVFVTCGSELSREWREFERSSTAILNAYVGPMADAYLSSLQERLAAGGFEGDLLMMQSNGGVFAVSDAVRQPIRLLESGPVAGIIGAAELGADHGFDDVMAFDMGGTTAKAAVVRGGVPDVQGRYYVGGYEGGYPIQVPVVDVVEIGTGGGSIAWVDDVGGLQVGPRSAGSSPGPACYGLGGEDPTVTDANLALGRLDPANFLGGTMALHPDRAARSLGEGRVAELGLDATELADGIVKIATLAMANALRRVTVERGRDPRDFVMVAYGGAGPLHATAVARELGVRRVLIPPMPGHFSAWGMLQAPIRRDFARTRLVRLDDAGAAGRLRELGGALLEDSAPWRDTLSDAPSVEYVVEARYAGQEHTIQVALDLDAIDLPAFAEHFHESYDQRYGHAAPDEVIEIVQVRLIATAALSAEVPPPASSYRDTAARPRAARPVYLDGGWRTVEVHDRAGLEPGARFEGPCIVEEHASTTVVDGDAEVSVLGDGTLLVEMGERG